MDPIYDKRNLQGSAQEAIRIQSPRERPFFGYNRLAIDS